MGNMKMAEIGTGSDILVAAALGLDIHHHPARALVRWRGAGEWMDLPAFTAGEELGLMIDYLQEKTRGQVTIAKPYSDDYVRVMLSAPGLAKVREGWTNPGQLLADMVMHVHGGFWRAQ